MKFSLIYEAQTVDRSRESEARTFHEMVEQCRLAEELGFDVIWAVEHTALTYYAHMSAPETFLAFVAGATHRIHLGLSQEQLALDAGMKRSYLSDLERGRQTPPERDILVPALCRDEAERREPRRRERGPVSVGDLEGDAVDRDGCSLGKTLESAIDGKAIGVVDKYDYVIVARHIAARELSLHIEVAGDIDRRAARACYQNLVVARPRIVGGHDIDFERGSRVEEEPALGERQ